MLFFFWNVLGVWGWDIGYRCVCSLWFVVGFEVVGEFCVVGWGLGKLVGRELEEGEGGEEELVVGVVVEGNGRGRRSMRRRSWRSRRIVE